MTGKGGLRGGFACPFGVIAGDQVLMRAGPKVSGGLQKIASGLLVGFGVRLARSR